MIRSLPGVPVVGVGMATLCLLLVVGVSGVDAQRLRARSGLTGKCPAASVAATRSSFATRRLTCGSYVALGDSYSSGQGNPPLVGGACARSASAYPNVLAAALRRRHRALLLRLVACSGARAKSDAPLVSQQYPSLNATTRLVTLTIGGNDVGFASVLRSCIESSQYQQPCQPIVGSAVNQALGVLGRSLPGVYLAVARRAPRAVVLVVGYPNLFRPGGSPAGCGVLSLHYQQLTAFSPANTAYLYRLGEALNRVIARAVSETVRDARHAHKPVAVDYVPPPAAFSQHTVCAAPARSWFTGIFTNAGQVELSLHPNNAGHTAIAATLIHFIFDHRLG
jgi:lysophospholipase L1-like esterase